MRDTLWVEDIMWALRVRKNRKEFDKWEVNEHRKEVTPELNEYCEEILHPRKPVASLHRNFRVQVSRSYALGLLHSLCSAKSLNLRFRLPFLSILNGGNIYGVHE